MSGRWEADDADHEDRTRAAGWLKPATPRGVGAREGLPRICPHPLVDHVGRRILLATDLSIASHDIDARAIELAQAAGAHLLVLAIIPSEASPDAAHRKRLAALDAPRAPAGD